MAGCVRCSLPAHHHPVSADDTFCLRFVEPAPLWMRVLNRLLGAPPLRGRER